MFYTDGQKKRYMQNFSINYSEENKISDNS